jgi:phosphoglycerol transferase MdoB-like AlkP superfamily enzyme
MHIVKAWHRHWHRRSGGTLFSAVAALIVSGYLLYYVADEQARRALSFFHWIVGLALPLAYLLHRLAKKIHQQKPQLRRHP